MVRSSRQKADKENSAPAPAHSLLHLTCRILCLIIVVENQQRLPRRIHDAPMSRWYQILPCLRRPQHRRAKGAWPVVFSKAWLLTLSTIISLLYLFFHFVLPHLLKFRLRTDLSWYDLGLYGFGPTRSYVSFQYESPVVEISQWNSGCDPRYTFLAPRGDSIPHPGPTILDAAGNLVWMKYNHDITQDFKLQRYQGNDYLTYWEGNEVAGGLGQGSWFMVCVEASISHDCLNLTRQSLPAGFDLYPTLRNPSHWRF